jgi:transcriptional regulator GlxA family with amidase domain
MKKNVGIFIFTDAEVLDFAGPYEVFSVASQINNDELFQVFTVAKTKSPVKAINGLSVNPDFSFKTAPKIDVLIISGGSGTRALLEDKTVLNWVNDRHKESGYTLSICSGARVMGKLGLLNNIPYCTHKGVYDHLKEIAPAGKPVKNKRFVNSGKLYTSGGISAGIDLSFHIVKEIHGMRIARNTAKYMEYHWVPGNDLHFRL